MYNYMLPNPLTFLAIGIQLTLRARTLEKHGCIWLLLNTMERQELFFNSMVILTSTNHLLGPSEVAQTFPPNLAEKMSGGPLKPLSLQMGTEQRVCSDRAAVLYSTTKHLHWRQNPAGLP